ncbi:MAG: phosphatase PAP2 family protein [Lawsonibacter sp.]|nr:phosphatase PAP2 family protein [Lawsonibacter sp.]
MLQTIQGLDGALLLAIQEAHTPLLDTIVPMFTRLGDVGFLWLLLSLLFLMRKSTRRAGVLSLCALVLGALCTNVVLKHLFQRPRPWLDWPIVPLVLEGDPNSFPSGHTCAAFAAGMIWARTLPKPGTRVWAVVLAVCMGLSRLYVGVHYPTDVLAGAIIGSLCAWAVWRTNQTLEKRSL